MDHTDTQNTTQEVKGFESYILENNIEEPIDGYFEWIEINPKIFAEYTNVNVGGYKKYNKYSARKLPIEERSLCTIRDQVEEDDFVVKSLFHEAFLPSLSCLYEKILEDSSIKIRNLSIQDLLTFFIEMGPNVVDFLHEDSIREEYLKIFDIFFTPQTTSDIFKKLPVEVKCSIVNNIGELLSIGFIDILEDDTKKRVLKELRKNSKPSQALKKTILEIEKE